MKAYIRAMLSFSKNFLQFLPKMPVLGAGQAGQAGQPLKKGENGRFLPLFFENSAQMHD